MLLVLRQDVIPFQNSCKCHICERLLRALSCAFKFNKRHIFAIFFQIRSETYMMRNRKNERRKTFSTVTKYEKSSVWKHRVCSFYFSNFFVAIDRNFIGKINWKMLFLRQLRLRRARGFFSSLLLLRNIYLKMQQGDRVAKIEYCTESAFLSQSLNSKRKEEFSRKKQVEKQIARKG